MANKVIAHIRRDYGKLFIKDDYTGDYLNLDDLHKMIQELTALAYEMSVGKSQHDLKQEIYAYSIRYMWASAVIHYPFEHPYLYWSGEYSGNNRSPKEPRFSGVYFITHPDKPELIKIGCSVDIYQRTKGLFHEYGKKPLRVVGYIETDEQFEVESFLHNKFSALRDEKEWFDYWRVIEWLEAESRQS